MTFEYFHSLKRSCPYTVSVHIYKRFHAKTNTYVPTTHTHITPSPSTCRSSVLPDDATVFNSKKRSTYLSTSIFDVRIYEDMKKYLYLLPMYKQCKVLPHILCLPCIKMKQVFFILNFKKKLFFNLIWYLYLKCFRY